MSADEKVTYPRLMYRGPASDQAETATATDAADFALKQKDGWRLTRVDKSHQPPAAPKSAISVPAQTLTVDPKDVKADPKADAKHDAKDGKK